MDRERAREKRSFNPLLSCQNNHKSGSNLGQSQETGTSSGLPQEWSRDPSTCVICWCFPPRISSELDQKRSRRLWSLCSGRAECCTWQLNMLCQPSQPLFHSEKHIIANLGQVWDLCAPVAETATAYKYQASGKFQPRVRTSAETKELSQPWRIGAVYLTFLEQSPNKQTYEGWK